MAISSFSDLKTQIGSWFNDRDDLATDAATFIALAEADFNRVLRVREMETSTTLTPSSGEAPLPADYLEWRTVTLLASRRSEIEYATPSYIEDIYGERESGTPRFFTIRGATMIIVPVSDTSVRLDYYQKITGLSDAAPSNWLLAKYPNLYLFQSLMYAAIFLGDDARQGKYGSLAGAQIAALQSDDTRARYARGAARRSGVAP